MAAELITPTDQLTGLPYVIAPSFTETDPTLHHAFHPNPRAEPRLATVSGLALRTCFMQIVEGEVHNQGPDAYHPKYKGPIIADSEKEHMETCVWAHAGALPRFCIDLSTEEPDERPLRHDEISFLREINPKDPYSYKNIHRGYLEVRAFFGAYLLKQDISHNESAIDAFLTSPDEETRSENGLILLREAAEIATVDMHGKYAGLKKANMFHPAAADTPTELVLYKLGKRDRKLELLPQLAEVLEGKNETEKAA
jgi:hypothetical protein